APEFREWTDKTGKFKVVALLVELDGDEVVLRRKDLDKEIRVPMSQLSSTDRRYLKDLEK
ncbi:MAG: SHD1 domain-containing protein, partial [Planctomycetota bacterium]|nr:SHD1 domain-containing protein [Planctomycetota bacterium]